jgi:hypothetical protein
VLDVEGVLEGSSFAGAGTMADADHKRLSFPASERLDDLIEG